jgi:hypothetical protein
VKVLLLLDIGGSMDDHVRECAELFSAARAEFKHMEHFYFHNCPYERLWRDNRRRQDSSVSTHEVLRTYGPDYKLVLVGDAAMSPYEIVQPGGSVEHWNEEPGSAWMGRLLGHFRRSAWLNPMPEAAWDRYHSVGMVRQLMERRMFPLTLAGVEAMTRELAR